MPEALTTGAADGHDTTYSLRDRSPHPYANLHNVDESHNEPFEQTSTNDPSLSQSETSTDPEGRRSGKVAGTASESGTEADDERPHLLKALPPPAFRPSKGLKGKDGTASPILTPSQLDLEGRRLSQGYFDRKRGRDKSNASPDRALEEERKLFQARRIAERVRRVSEAALVGVIGLLVAYGSRIWRYEWPWYLIEILSQALAIAGLVAFYPLRMVSVERERGHLHIWSRFRIPPSFDPATVLYPTFLPVLVSLSLLPTMPELLLPNLLLGLASLPGRLFPSWSWLADINVLHWTISMTPLIVAKLLNQASVISPLLVSKIRVPVSTADLGVESLALLYPLHHCLLPVIHYLTTTSLLPSEKHLLSTALINLLYFSGSPQMNILRALLWIGGVAFLVVSFHVLRWNVALARVPSWRFKDSVGKRAGRHSLLRELKNGLVSWYRGLTGGDFEDEDGEDIHAQIKTHPVRTSTINTQMTAKTSAGEPKSAVEASAKGRGLLRSVTSGAPQLQQTTRRRNTISGPDRASLLPSSLFDHTSPDRSRSRRKGWGLSLTPTQAALRKGFYSVYFYLCTVAIVFLPIRIIVANDALDGDEPFMWALDYLFGDLPTLNDVWKYAGSHDLSSHLSSVISRILTAESVPSLQSSIGEANVRLLVIFYWLIPLFIGIVAVLLLSSYIEVDTRRKIFHGIMVTMLLPTTFVDPCFCALTLSLVLAVFLLLEVVRAGQVPPLGTAIGRFIAPYVDGRDLRGPMVVSHVFLLIGCAIPLWLSLAGAHRSEGGRWPSWELENGSRQVAMVSGVVCVGMGDAAASLIGRRYGRRKWPWIGGKSLEGSAAFAGAVTVGLMAAKAWLKIGGWNDVYAGQNDGFEQWLMYLVKAMAAGCGASFMEAVLTGANDNVVVPVALWLLVRGLRL
ncbi:hypothetical protein MBLNU457_g2963t1 [Dothideomycetes sp. NU457]